MHLKTILNILLEIEENGAYYFPINLLYICLF